MYDMIILITVSCEYVSVILTRYKDVKQNFCNALATPFAYKTSDDSNVQLFIETKNLLNGFKNLELTIKVRK